MKIHSLKIFFLGAIILLFHCKQEIKTEFSNTEELAKYTLSLIDDGDHKALFSALMKPEVYKKDIYPFSDAAENENPLSAEDFWNIHMRYSRASGIENKVGLYRDRDVEFMSVGTAQQKYSQGKYVLHRKIPIKLKVTNDQGKRIEITDRTILGVVTEKNGKFQLLNIFKK